MSSQNKEQKNNQSPEVPESKSNLNKPNKLTVITRLFDNSPLSNSLQKINIYFSSLLALVATWVAVQTCSQQQEIKGMKELLKSWTAQAIRSLPSFHDAGLSLQSMDKKIILSLGLTRCSGNIP